MQRVGLRRSFQHHLGGLPHSAFATWVTVDPSFQHAEDDVVFARGKKLALCSLLMGKFASNFVPPRAFWLSNRRINLSLDVRDQTTEVWQQRLRRIRSAGSLATITSEK